MRVAQRQGGMALMCSIYEMPRNAIISRMSNKTLKPSPLFVLACLLAARPFVFSHTQPAADSKPPTSAAPQSASVSHSPYHSSRFSKKAGEYYSMVWGVDSLSVKWTESGEVIRFSYRVLDAQKAKALNDKKNEPALFD